MTPASSTISSKCVLGMALMGLGGTGLLLTSSFFGGTISKYEQALVNFLNDDAANDIIFDVKKGENGTDDLGKDDLTFSSTNSTPVTVKVKVMANTAEPNKYFKKGNSNKEASNLEKLKKLSGKESWTWECSFKFTAPNDDKSKPIQDKYKNRIWKDADLGLFGLLKKDISTITNPNPADKNKWTKEEVKKVKVGFIERCGDHRGKTKNAKLNKDGKVEDKDIKVGDIAIAFKKQTNANDLVPSDESTFNHWFINENQSSKTYPTSTQ